MFKKILWIFLISMVPVIELRAAIPVGAGMQVPFWWNYLVAVLGNMLPVPFILLFIPKILDFMKRHRIFPRLVSWIERKGMRGVEKLKQREARAAEAPLSDAETADAAPLTADAQDAPVLPACDEDKENARSEGKRKRITFGVCLGLFAFVAVPLPGTGAWTGSLVAALFGVPKRYAIPTIFLGVLTAGAVMALASYGIVAAFQIFT